MIHRSNFSIRLLVCFCLSVLNTGLINTAYAAQKISGKVTNVITAAGFTYAEVDTGKEKVWAAGTGITPLENGDVVAFTSEMPMKNFHSKTLGRDFPVIYFIKQYITGKETATSAVPHDQKLMPTMIKPVTAKFFGKQISTQGEVKAGGYLREATLDGLNGSSKKFSDFKGKPLIINIWASWCGPCRAEMGSLERLASRYNGKQFNIIGISTDDYRNKAESLIEQTNITFENFLDHKLQLEKMLGANTIPLTILVDAQGRVLNKVHGSREWDSPEIINGIGKAFDIKLVN
jgi:thiol-disulfide isomerase/thioredoxin